jgi:methylated-DNA-[protein]-cysteine S-methyltransferase
VRIAFSQLSSPLGDLIVALRDGLPCALAAKERGPTVERGLRRRFGTFTPTWSGCPRELSAALEGYFDGCASALDGVRVDPGGTPFQRAVWEALRSVPFGRTTTYGAIGRSIGRPGAARAVGAACAANPLWLLVPCHRALGSDGALVGFAAGLGCKRWLLEHEATGRPSRGARAGER